MGTLRGHGRTGESRAGYALTPVESVRVTAARPTTEPIKSSPQLSRAFDTALLFPVAVLVLAGVLAACQAAILVLGPDAPRALPVLAGAIALVLLGALPVTIWWVVRRLRSAGEAEEQALRDLMGASTDACLWWWEPSKDRAWFSERWEELFGFVPTSQHALGSWTARVHPADREVFRSEFERLLDGWTDTIEMRCRLIVRRDRHRWVQIRAVVSRAPDGQAARVAGSVLDVTERHRAESELAHSAFHDPLTGLPNRALFRDRLAHALARARRDTDYDFAVLHLDVDRFAMVNDVLGHRQGDKLLVELALRLEKCVRPGDTIARYGGDEFTVLIDPLSRPGQADEVAERLQEAVASPLHLGGRDLVMSATIGTALSDPKYTTPDQLIRNAAAAKNSAKEEGGKSHVLFNSAMHKRRADLMDLESELRHAIEHRELQVHYQPIVDSGSLRIKGFEALVRWPHPTRGWVSPAEFVPVAEQNGLIEKLGMFVASEVCWTVAGWPKNGVTVSVNLSPIQLSSPSLVEDLKAVFDETGVDPRRLNFELTETAVMEDEAQSLGVLTQLKDLGVRLCIDDFGTGHSSLLYLHRYPIDVLKIDRAFVQGMDPAQPGIVRTIVDLARSLGMSTVAEGIEEPEQQQVLEDLGCDALQGFLYSRAVPGEDAERMLKHATPWTQTDTND